jgi:hypothetical protein
MWTFTAVDADRREAKVIVEVWLDGASAEGRFYVTSPDGARSTVIESAPVTIERSVYTKRILLAVVGGNGKVAGMHRTVIGAAEDWAGKVASRLGQKALLVEPRTPSREPQRSPVWGSSMNRR